MRFHHLKDGATSLWLAHGESLKTIQELLGHANFGATAKVCTDALPHLKHDTVDKIAASMFGLG